MDLVTGIMATASKIDRPSSGKAVVSIAIGGMTCGACAARIERRLNDLDGVEASVNYASERARVTLLADRPVRTLVDEIRNVGYSAELVEDRTQFTNDAVEIDRRARSWPTTPRRGRPVHAPV